MAKKIIAFLVCVMLIVSCVSILSGCQKTPEIKIVYLGDSIAEALLGPSPVSERDNYGYYALVGKRNNYTYINRAVSGHQTKQLLNLLSSPDEIGLKTISHLRTADIIHISILGNDFLQTNLGETILLASNGDYNKVNEILVKSKRNFAGIYEALRTLNSDAVIMFQTVYNPVSEQSTLLSASVRSELAKIGIEESEYRELGYEILSKLNAVIIDYLAENEGAYYITDAYKAFNDIYNEDPVRGDALIYADWVHPSNEGHAVMADVLQAQLEELGLADPAKALKNYKNIRIEQLKRMYKDQVDYRAVTKSIKKADSCAAVTKIYFDVTRDKLPKYA